MSAFRAVKRMEDSMAKNLIIKDFEKYKEITYCWEIEFVSICFSIAGIVFFPAVVFNYDLKAQGTLELVLLSIIFFFFLFVLYDCICQVANSTSIRIYDGKVSVITSPLTFLHASKVYDFKSSDQLIIERQPMFMGVEDVREIDINADHLKFSISRVDSDGNKNKLAREIPGIASAKKILDELKQDFHFESVVAPVSMFKETAGKVAEVKEQELSGGFETRIRWPQEIGGLVGRFALFLITAFAVAHPFFSHETFGVKQFFGYYWMFLVTFFIFLFDVTRRIISFFNYSVLKIESGRISVSFEPVTWMFKTKNIQVHEIKQIYVERYNTGMRFSHGRNTNWNYALFYIDSAGISKELIRHIATYRVALRVEQQLEKYLTIEDQKVADEYVPVEFIRNLQKD
jgi:hypothetical protein